MNVIVRDLSTGKTIYHGYFAELGHVWPVIAPVVGEWFEVPADDVCCGESDDGDTLTINGTAVASIEHVYHRVELRRPFLEAAE